MIPLQLTLKNFLSYREATLDFRGLHVACVCGANGAGKSSLLESIAWVIWGQSRATSEDDVIHLGTTDVLVDFIFQCHHQTYRIIRSRHRGQASTLEFQIQTAKGFRSLTEKGLRATQQLILQHLRLDYDTFINSAYLRQGRADEFMLKRPTDRKQILTDLLKLDQYDNLAEQAKEQSRQLKAEIAALERNLATIEAQLEQGAGLAAAEATLQITLRQKQEQQEQDRNRLRQLQSMQQHRQAGLQQLALQQQQQQHLTQEGQRLQQELTTIRQQQRQVEATLQEAETIATGYNQFQRLHAEEELLSVKFQAYQAAQTQKQQLQQQQTEQINAVKDQRRQAQTQLESLYQQQQEIQQKLTKVEEVEAALERVRQARTRLTALDQRQMQAVPLMQRRQQIQSQLDRIYTRKVARLEELQALQRQLENQQDRQPQLQQSIARVTQQIEHLEQRRIYQQQVREKGMERRTFMERLQERQRDYEQELAELDQKLALLRQEPLEVGTAYDVGTSNEARYGLGHEAGYEADYERVKVAEQRRFQAAESSVLSPSAEVAVSPPRFSLNSSFEYPPCPLCDRPLDEHHWAVVLEQHQAERQEICTQLWVIREQLTTSDREIRVLRQEYRELEKELAQYGKILERRGQLQQQLADLSQEETRLQQVQAEIVQLQQSLQQADYAPELQEELRLIDHSLQQLNYDDKDHALVRGEVDRWRWAEIKHAEIKQAQRRQASLAEQQPHLEQTIAHLEQQLQVMANSPLQRQINQLNHHLAAMGYNLEQHTAVRNALRQAQTWQTRYQELVQAQQTYPQVQQRLREMAERWATWTHTLQQVTMQVEQLARQLEQTPDPQEAIQAIDQQMQQRRVQLDEQLAQLGRLQQQQQQLEKLTQQRADLDHQLQTARRQYRIYQELGQAFGKNGIQALMIENVLPQLEAETNQILGRLTANQLHVQFVTQRAKRNSSRNDKLIDTLDILISDVQGTRPYETYSGGEAFRVNFAIRLAMARLLAQRSGMALQMLIVDEGFGTQDQAGCDRLIGAINAIASDFACVLTVTHVQNLKEAFQTRIEVVKTEQGSNLRLLM